jgi:predicted small secreted protein
MIALKASSPSPTFGFHHTRTIAQRRFSMTQQLRNMLANPCRFLASLFAIIVLGLAVSQMTACNTTEGVGKDVKAAGEGLEDAARDAKD